MVEDVFVPELPEVEVVRRGVAEHAIGRTVSSVEVLHLRAVRRHVPGPEDLAGRLAGRVLSAARRRGKYLWLELGDGEPAPSGGEALVVHLGMSGQLLVQPSDVPDEKHLRVRFRFADGGPELRFIDQRTFGGLHLADLVEVDGLALPEPIEHIAPDPLEEAFDLDRLAKRLRSRRTGIKRALLDQSLVSGIGNIYADEALWRAKLHWARPTATLTKPKIRELFDGVTEVMQDALRAGGTSFDALYVNVNGESGYFSRDLDVYGRAGQPCNRCGTPIERVAFMNRSSHFCPKCQRER